LRLGIATSDGRAMLEEMEGREGREGNDLMEPGRMYK
jgi:hypothetical protein